jgi:hypothetical protein
MDKCKRGRGQCSRQCDAGGTGAMGAMGAGRASDSTWVSQIDVRRWAMGRGRMGSGVVVVVVVGAAIGDRVRVGEDIWAVKPKRLEKGRMGLWGSLAGANTHP